MADASGLSFAQTILASVVGGAVVGVVSIVTSAMTIRNDRRKQRVAARYEEARKALILLGEDFLKVAQFLTKREPYPTFFQDYEQLIMSIVAISDTVSICLPSLSKHFKDYRALRRDTLNARMKLGPVGAPEDSLEQKEVRGLGEILSTVYSFLEDKIQSEIRRLIGAGKARPTFASGWKAVSPYLVGRYRKSEPGESQDRASLNQQIADLTKAVEFYGKQVATLRIEKEKPSTPEQTERIRGDTAAILPSMLGSLPLATTHGLMQVITAAPAPDSKTFGSYGPVLGRRTSEELIEKEKESKRSEGKQP